MKKIYRQKKEASRSLSSAPRCPVGRFPLAARVVCLCKIEAVTYRATGSANSFNVLMSLVLAESIESVVCELSIHSAVTAGSAFCDGSGIRFLPSPVSLFCTSLIITPLCVNHKDHVRRSDGISLYTYRWQREKSDTLPKKNTLSDAPNYIMGKYFQCV